MPDQAGALRAEVDHHRGVQTVPDPVTGYRPTLSAAEIERLRAWHERAYEAGRAVTEDQTFEYLGARFVVPPGVMPITPVSHVLGDAVLSEVATDERVLDMGTGSGVNAVLAATRGAQVLAVDINPAALDAARANATRNSVDGRVEVRHSDVFDAVEGRFDLIIFDPPFRWFPARDMFEVATADPGYRSMTRFFTGAAEHLTERGRMLVFFGTTGDLGYMRKLIARVGHTAETVANLRQERDGVSVEYFTFRVRPSSQATGDHAQ